MAAERHKSLSVKGTIYIFKMQIVPLTEKDYCVVQAI